MSTMFELLPGVGIALPHNAGVLRLGMPEQAVRERVSALVNPRDTWVCGANWSFGAEFEGVRMWFFGDTIDRTGDGGHSGLASAGLSRGQAPIPVVLNDIDLFGYPSEEVRDALGAIDDPAIRLHPAAEGEYLPGVTLSVYR